jgi:hypothetical protein
MTADPPIIPSETQPQPVPDHPGWVWWPGIAGLVYAKHANGIDPPVVVRAHNFTALLARIRAAEEQR